MIRASWDGYNFSRKWPELILSNDVYIPNYDSNLILLGQLREIGISYHDHPEFMILEQGGK